MTVLESGKVVLKTKKAAREAGLRTQQEWIVRFLIPLRDATGTEIKGEVFYSESECEELISRTSASHRSLTVPDSATPADTKYRHGNGTGSFYYAVFRLSDCVAKKQRKRPSPMAAKRAVETKKKKILSQIEELEIILPKMEESQLVREAVASYNGWQSEIGSGSMARPDDDPKFIARISVNYLRHCCTDYDDVLNGIAGRVGKTEATKLLTEKIYSAIAESYPHLSDEADRQMWDRLDQLIVKPLWLHRAMDSGRRRTCSGVP